MTPFVRVLDLLTRQALEGPLKWEETKDLLRKVRLLTPDEMGLIARFIDALVRKEQQNATESGKDDGGECG
jgi:hypothetical protein